MLRFTTLITAFLFLAGIVSGQENRTDTTGKGKSRMTFDFSGAYSLALGKYSGTEVEEDYSGFASGGFVAQIKLNWLGKKDFGLGISYAFQQNALQKQFKDTVLSGGDPNGLGEKPWNNHYLLAGPVMVKEIKRFVVDAAILGGVVIASSTTFSLMVPTDSVNYTVSSGAGTGFAYQIRVSAGYKVSRKVTLMAGISYLGGSPTRKKDLYYYSYVEDPPGSGNYVGTYLGSETVIKKKISTINPGIGIIINL
jgi:hypothetical protein